MKSLHFLPHSVTLQLTDSLCTVHPVFHISMLEPATPNLIPNHFQPPPLPIIVNDKLEFEISEILNSKIDNQHHCLQAIVSCPLDRVWGHWWRNFMEPCFQAQTCFWTCCRFPLCISSQVWPFFKSLTQAHFTSIWSLIWSFHTFYKSNQFYLLILLSHSRIIIIITSSQSPHPSSGLSSSDTHSAPLGAP